MTATPEAMQAALKWKRTNERDFGLPRDFDENIAHALAAYAAAARADERRVFAPFVIREALSEYEIHARGVPERLIELITEAAIAKRGAK